MSIFLNLHLNSCVIRNVNSHVAALESSFTSFTSGCGKVAKHPTDPSISLALSFSILSSGWKDGSLKPVNGWHANSCHWSFMLEATLTTQPWKHYFPSMQWNPRITQGHPQPSSTTEGSRAWIPSQSQLAHLSSFRNESCLAQNKLLLPKRYRIAKLYHEEPQKQNKFKSAISKARGHGGIPK